LRQGSAAVVFAAKPGFNPARPTRGQRGACIIRDLKMRRILNSVLLLTFAVSPTLAQTLSKDPAQSPSGVYRINVDHTQILFSTVHLGLTDFYGRFDKISGTMKFDNKQPERSSLDATIDMSTIDTPNPRLNDMLKSLFRPAEYPTAILKSTAITRTGPDTGQIAGMLTIKGVSRPLALSVRFNGGEHSPMGGYSLGFEATGIIRRSDFDLNKTIWSSFVSDEVHLTIEAMFDQQ
jgi:polyisoprenoid-binding protein YceI